jgi:PAS domain S-box-containing protein
MGTVALSGLDALVEHDVHGVITDWNEGSEALFGWTRAEAIGMHARELFPERNRTRHDASLRALLLSTRAGTKYEVTVRHRHGREFPVEFTTWTLGSGTHCRVTAFAREMTPEIRVSAASSRPASRRPTNTSSRAWAARWTSSSSRFRSSETRTETRGYLSKPVNPRALFQTVEA